MIGVKGQWEFYFELNGRDDLIDSRTLKRYSTTSETGNVVPGFSLVFETAEPDIKDFLRNKNILNVAYGDGTFFNPKQQWISLKTEHLRTESKTTVTMEGILNVIPYITQTRIFISDKQNSSDVISQIASSQFIVDSDVATDDSQYWIQHNITDRRFINEMLKYSNLPGSFIIHGIDELANFIMRDGIALLDKSPFYTLHYAGTQNRSDHINFLSDYNTLDRTGVIACWLGKGRSKPTMWFEDGITEQLDVDFADFNPNDDRTENLGYRYNNDFIINENVHPEIHTSMNRNLGGLGHFSNNHIDIEYALNKIDDLKLLDVVNFVDDRQDSLKRIHQENISGKYIVGKIIQSVTVKEYTKCLHIYRPSNR